MRQVQRDEVFVLDTCLHNHNVAQMRQVVPADVQVLERRALLDVFLEYGAMPLCHGGID